MKTVFKRFLLSLLVLLIAWLAGFGLFVLCAKRQVSYVPPVDAIVVLTGGKGRVESGLALFAQGLSGDLFITGVFPNVSLNDITSKWRGEQPLPDCCITLGYEATTTEENMHELKKWISAEERESIALVTSHYHMPRAMIELKRAHLDHLRVYPYPVNDDSEFSPAYYWQVMVIEYHKTLYRWVQSVFEPFVG